MNLIRFKVNPSGLPIALPTVRAISNPWIARPDAFSISSPLAGRPLWLDSGRDKCLSERALLWRWSAIAAARCDPKIDSIKSDRRDRMRVSGIEPDVWSAIVNEFKFPLEDHAKSWWEDLFTFLSCVQMLMNWRIRRNSCHSLSFHAQLKETSFDNPI